ncbi:putative nima interactive protein [Anopheles sinensis]|uniref:Putative nima interactive protein n=1 Tax=Anopheles sinensis TaxID=74873 RepID=A0A084WTR1_ANOSI|nr:putative nima interactive protein [Anopheles sinensis]
MVGASYLVLMPTTVFGYLVRWKMHHQSAGKYHHTVGPPSGISTSYTFTSGMVKSGCPFPGCPAIRFVAEQSKLMDRRGEGPSALGHSGRRSPDQSVKRSKTSKPSSQERPPAMALQIDKVPSKRANKVSVGMFAMAAGEDNVLPTLLIVLRMHFQ